MMEPGAPPRAKLELLVRHPTDEGFEVREVPSAVAYLQLRPHRIDASSLELAQMASRVDAQVRYILRNKKTDRYILLSEPERFLWEQMNGKTSVQDMATAYVLRYGTFDFDVIPTLIAKLRLAGILELKPASRLREALRNRVNPLARLLEGVLAVLERVHLSSRRVQRLFERAYRWGGRLLFTRAAAIVCGVLSVVGLVAGVSLWPEAAQVAAPLGRQPLLAVLGVKLLFFVTLAAHQIVHGLALVHYGRRVREFGFTLLHGFVPTFYVDVTDIFMASRRARVVTAVTGTLVHLVLGAGCFAVAAQLPHGLPQAFVAASGLIQLQAFVVSLYPFCFVEMDGYHVLVDWLGLPTLKYDAVHFVHDSLWRRVVQRRGLNRRECIWVGYYALSVASVAGFIWFNVWTILHVVFG
jgi:putative peptide zinc metalloprotease protein